MTLDRRGTSSGLTATLASILLVFAPPAAARADAPPVHLTVEVRWSPGPAVAAPQVSRGTPGVTLGISEGGRVLDAVAWQEPGEPPSASPPFRPRAVEGGKWILGDGPEGRVRARIEAPIEAILTVDGGAIPWSSPMAALLDGPRRSTSGDGTIIEVRRLPWDPLEVRVDGDGTATPGSLVPVTVGINLLTPEPATVAVTLSVTLRSIRESRPIWTQTRRFEAASNLQATTGRIITLPMPPEPGTYVLELRAGWSPSGPNPEGGRLGRWWRQLRGRSAEETIRRVSLTVVPPPGTSATATIAARGGDSVVDVAELGRPRGLRPRLEGRQPTDVEGMIEAPWPLPDGLLVDAPRRERLWSLIGRVGSDLRPLGPADGRGLGWIASPMSVAHPDRPHRLELSVVGGDPKGLAVALIAPGPRPRLLLDARGIGESIPEGGHPRTLSWTVWPDADEPVLVVANRSPERPLWLGDATLVELADEPAPLPIAGPPPGGGRSLAVRIADATALERFGGANDDGPDDPSTRARHLAAYLGSVGASAVVLPEVGPDRAVRNALEGQAAEDPIGPDRRSLMWATLKDAGFSTVVEVATEGVTLPGLPPSDSIEAQRLDLSRIDREGRRDEASGSYSILRPEVREALTRHVLSSLGPRETGPSSTEPVPSGPDGILLRLGVGPTLPGRPDAGLDDPTYARFVAEAIQGGKAPGLDNDDPGRFDARRQFVTGPASIPWLSWRSRVVASYYEGLADDIAEASPGAILMLATPTLDGPAARDEAERCDREGLPPDAAWRAIGLDLADWSEATADSMIVLRGAVDGEGMLAHDLATHPTLDAQLIERPSRGLLLEAASPGPTLPGGALRLSAAAATSGDAAIEPFGHALAALDAGWVVVSCSTIVGREEQVGHFAQVFRALPEPSAEPPSPTIAGAVVRARTEGERTYLALANDTPYPVRVSALIATSANAAVEDLGRGVPSTAEPMPAGLRLTAELGPFGTSAIRIDASDARVSSFSVVEAEGRSRHRSAVAGRLRELASGGSIGHLNPGFEPDSIVQRTSATGDSPPEPAPEGWSVEGAEGASIAIDPNRPQSGRGSLRVEASGGSATAVSPAFLSPGPIALLRAELRTVPADAKVRVRIDSDPGASSSVRLAADLPAINRQNWSPMALRVPGLPADGASPLRLRFELRGAGRLWIDDLELSGPGLSQARSCLTAALQAFDEGRYADFARLAGTHWVAEAGGPIDPRSPAVAPVREVATDLPDRPLLR